ncbi:MAG: large-conductance mechanosensitive channel protein MscL [Bacteroidales bacterium]|nr:large-conductance mechanosensitive channel protein MscL [Bacteroidales bacterium]
MGKFLKEFKEFAMKGNVVDMAVGVVIGGAFGKIVTSLVSDVIMPLIGQLAGGLNFTDWKWVLKAATEEAPEVAVTYGNFLQVIFDFIIIAFSIFVVLKAINKAASLRKKKEEEAKAAEAPAEPVTPEEIVLLREIRDSLKK